MYLRLNVTQVSGTHPCRLFLFARLFSNVIDAVYGLVQLWAAVPAAQGVAERGRVVQPAGAARTAGGCAGRPSPRTR